MSREGELLQYLDPTGPKSTVPLAAIPPLSLSGKCIGYVSNGWSSFDKIGTLMEAVLRRDHGIRDFRRYRIASAFAAPKELLDTIRRECDAAVVGMAN